MGIAFQHVTWASVLSQDHLTKESHVWVRSILASIHFEFALLETSE